MATESLSPSGLALNSARLSFAEQIAFFRQKLGNALPTEKWTDMHGAGHDRAVVVAGAMKADLITDFAKAIDGFVTRGENLRDFASRFDDLVDKHGWNYTGERDWRIRTIYQTNLATSYAAGRLVQLQKAGEDGLLWMYKHSELSVTPRELHLSWDGLTLSPNDPWWKTHYPPSGWGCRCYCIAVHPADVKRLGGRIAKAPDDGSRTVTLGSQTLEVPKGIDAGWAYMPGASVVDELRAIVDAKVQKLPEKVAKDLVAKVAAVFLPSPAPSLPGRIRDELVLPKSGFAAKAAAVALDSIDLVHSVPSLPNIPLKASSSKKFQGAYRYTRDSLTPVEILISKTSVNPELTAVHEIGHFLDQQSINGKVGFASKSDPLLQAWRDAVDVSDATKAMKAVVKTTTDGFERDRGLYYLTPHEQWARCYAQYIAERSGNSVLLEQVAKIVGRPPGAYASSQWEEADFKSIANAMDVIFKKIGWSV